MVSILFECKIGNKYSAQWVYGGSHIQIETQPPHE